MLRRTISFTLNRLCFRKLYSTKVCKLDAKSVQEIKVPVPWGNISGCWWGSRDVQPVICLHGWLDNAGVWQPLLQTMPNHYSFLAIDFPGEGLSSHFPKFHNYSVMENIFVIRRIIKYLGLDTVTLLGHSGGSAMSFLYSAIFNDEVKGFFGIDLLVLAFDDYRKRAEKVAELIDRKIELGLRDASKNKVYSWDEAKQSWCEATRGSVSPTSAEILMKRGVQEVGSDKYIFTRDHRQKTTSSEGLTSPECMSLASALKCHAVLIKAKKSPFFAMGIKECPGILDVIKENAKSYEFHDLEGRHHIHMDQPEVIAPLLDSFLQRVELS